jgi:hypothetical protein
MAVRRRTRVAVRRRTRVVARGRTRVAVRERTRMANGMMVSDLDKVIFDIFANHEFLGDRTSLLDQESV